MKRSIVIAMVLCATIVAALSFVRAEEEMKPAAFPESWMGKYSGPLNILGTDGPVQTITMHLEVAPSEKLGEWHWRLQYEGQPVRDYLLMEVDAERGLYRIDEKNSIILDAQRYGNELHSAFSMNGMVLNAVYRMTDGGVEFRIATVRMEAGATTGGEGGVPAVGSHQTIGAQFALLKKVE